jgi:integrase
MPKHLLTAREVQTAAPGDHKDGDGLFLRVQGRGASWLLRYTAANGKRRELGLGGADRYSQESAGESLKKARKEADQARDLIEKGTDPIDAKKAARAIERAQASKDANLTKGGEVTLRRYLRAYHADHIEPILSEKHAQQWLNSVEQHVPASVLDASIGSITAMQLLNELVPIWRKVPETGSRIFQRLALVFDASVIDGLRKENPAAPIKKELRRRAGRRVRGNFESMPYCQVPSFITALRKEKGNAARCLEFLILCAARTNEALTAEWGEIDKAARIWTIPAAKMKCREQHVVFLSERALEVIEGQADLDKRFVFPSATNSKRPMSNMSMLQVLTRMELRGEDVEQSFTVHGFRASFSTWSNETGIARPDVIEAALAHREQNLVRAAYNRSQFITERRALMDAWCAYATELKISEASAPAGRRQASEDSAQTPLG